MPERDPNAYSGPGGAPPRDVIAALDAAAAAAEVIRRYFRDGAAVEIKADNTPVTAADREAEQIIRASLRRTFPHDDMFGEEFGREASGAHRTWLIDPIDGTKSFVRRLPFFSTQIALAEKGDLRAGVSSAPLFDEVAWAARGAGAWLNGRRLHVSACADLGSATLLLGNPAPLAADPRRWAAVGELVQRCDRVRGYGDFYQFHALARGAVDVVVDTGVNILDIAAASVLMEEAGATVSDLDGARVAMDTTAIVAASTPALHAQVLRCLNGD